MKTVKMHSHISYLYINMYVNYGPAYKSTDACAVDEWSDTIYSITCTTTKVNNIINSIHRRMLAALNTYKLKA